MDDLQRAVQIETLKGQVRALAEENAKLRVERDFARAEVAARLPYASAEQEAEMRRAFETGIPNGIATVIAELEAGGGP